MVTTGDERAVGPFCFGSCNTCPPPTAPRDAGGGGSGRRRSEQSYYPLWMVFAIAAIAFATIALGAPITAAPIAGASGWKKAVTLGAIDTPTDPVSRRGRQRGRGRRLQAA